MSNQIETYTFGEVDELAGGLLYVGGIHTALGIVLDATRYRHDLTLIEYVNHAPAGLVSELLGATLDVIVETERRLTGLRTAVEAALDYNAERQATPEVQPDVAAKFDELIDSLYPERKKNGK